MSSLSGKHFHLISGKRFLVLLHAYETRAKKWKSGTSGRKEMLADKPPGFWKPLLASEWSTWLAQLVKKIDMCQSRVCFILRGHDSHISFLWLLFTLVGKICLLMCKSIFFDHFQNVKHFLWLNKSNRGFRLLNLFSKVPPVSETLKAIFLFSAIVSCNVFSRWAQLAR